MEVSDSGLTGFHVLAGVTVYKNSMGKPST